MFLCCGLPYIERASLHSVLPGKIFFPFFFFFCHLCDVAKVSRDGCILALLTAAPAL